MTDVVTGEAVPLELRLAKLPSRALSLGIDVLVYAVCGIALYGLVVNVVPAVDTALATALGLAATITLLVAVPATIETLTRGRSLGKLALGLRVVRDDGGPITARHALVRALSGVFADFIVTSGIGAIFCSLLNERGKRIGDVLAGTVVIRERIPAPAALPPMPPPLAAWATTLELSRLPNDLALAARNYLTRYAQLSPQVRDDLGARLATQVAQVVSPPPPSGVPPLPYLAAVLAERGRRESARLTGRPSVTAPRPGAPAAASSPAAPPASPAPTTRPTQAGSWALPERQPEPTSGQEISGSGGEQNGTTGEPVAPARESRTSTGFVPPA